MALSDKYPLEKTKPIKKTIAAGIVYIIMFLFIIPFLVSVLFAARSLIMPPLLIIFGILIVLIPVVCIVLKYIYELYYLKYYFYDEDGKNLIIKKGVFSKSEITLPFARIQDVYVDQDILDRMFGLYDLHVSSATAISGYLSHIDGVNKASSDELRTLILEKIKTHER